MSNLLCLLCFKSLIDGHIRPLRYFSLLMRTRDSSCSNSSKYFLLGVPSSHRVDIWDYLAHIEMLFSITSSHCIVI